MFLLARMLPLAVMYKRVIFGVLQCFLKQLGLNLWNCADKVDGKVINGAGQKYDGNKRKKISKSVTKASGQTVVALPFSAVLKV